MVVSGGPGSFAVVAYRNLHRFPRCPQSGCPATNRPAMDHPVATMTGTGLEGRGPSRPWFAVICIVFRGADGAAAPPYADETMKPTSESLSPSLRHALDG